jgi:pimeloyl-ACP methyl ester carboxylesterase
MSVMTVYPPRPRRRERVIALHCSGASPAQWGDLAETLGGRYQLEAPEHYGSSRPWTGEHAFTLADEAARTLELIDEAEGKVHLVGHSYGGGVALMVALARPHSIASMALYEPSAFHLLPSMGVAGSKAHTEIAAIAGRVCQGLVTGDYAAAAASFVDYWNGPGAWQAMRPTLRQALLRWLPKAPLDFHALFAGPTSAVGLERLAFPVLILRGERAPTPTALIAEHLSRLLPAARLLVLDGAGHMGPITHAPEVSAMVAQHIAASEADGAGDSRPPPSAQRLALGCDRVARERGAVP